MDFPDLTALSKYLTSNKIDWMTSKGIVKKHWIVPPEKQYLRVLKHVFDILKLDVDKELMRFKKKDSCPSNRCVCPNCFNIIPINRRKNIKNFDFTKEDIIELAEDIDLDEMNRIGKLKYFEEFNADQPEILRVTLHQFNQAVFYKESMLK